MKQEETGQKQKDDNNGHEDEEYENEEYAYDDDDSIGGICVAWSQECCQFYHVRCVLGSVIILIGVHVTEINNDVGRKCAVITFFAAAYSS